MIPTKKGNFAAQTRTMKKKPSPMAPRPRMSRTHRESFLLNDKEYEALNRYCAKYRVGNKSRFMREAVMRVIQERFGEDTPRLF